MVRMAEQYGLPPDDIPERNLRKLALVAGAKTYDEAADLAKKAKDSLFLCVLVMWGKKQIPGPTTIESLERDAKKADGLARMLEDKGNDDAAKKQRKKADELRKQADKLAGRK